MSCKTDEIAPVIMIGSAAYDLHSRDIEKVSDLVLNKDR